MRFIARNLPADKADLDVKLEAVSDVVVGVLPSFTKLANGQKRYALIPPDQRVEVRATPQARPFSPTAFMIENARDWRVHGFRIGNTPQMIGLPPEGSMPAEILNGLTFVSDKIVPGQEYGITVSYAGTSEEPQPFICDVIGDAL